jgi:thiaminase/transcriptional activator TenA
MIAGVTETWTAHLWSSIADTYQAILAHPFVTGLTDGTLPETSFAHYVAQDAHYLRDYARALMVVGSKAPSHLDVAMFARHAAGAVDVELTLHTQLLDSLGLSGGQLESTAVTPTTQAYTSYLLATAHAGSFAEGLAAVLPCYWIYQRVGAHLVRAGSPDPRYQSWIDTYGGAEFGEVVHDVLALTDTVGASLSPAQTERAGRHFQQTAKYEWMFWDASWRQESWPV